MRRKPDINATLSKLSLDELRVLAKKLRVIGFSRMSKQGLIDEISIQDTLSIQKHLKITWWDKYHTHVYGLVGVLALMIAILTYPAFWNSEKVDGFNSLKDLVPSHDSSSSIYFAPLNDSSSFFSLKRAAASFDSLPPVSGSAWDFSGRALSPLLVISSDETSHSDLDLIRNSWPGEVSSLPAATKEDFIDAINGGYSILHFETPVGVDFIEFEDGNLSISQFEDVLSFHDDIILVSIQGCFSFRISKALEKSKIEYSLVSRPDLSVDIRDTFYGEFYQELAKNISVEEAYEKAIVHTNALLDIEARELIMFWTQRFYRGW